MSEILKVAVELLALELSLLPIDLYPRTCPGRLAVAHSAHPSHNLSHFLLQHHLVRTKLVLSLALSILFLRDQMLVGAA